MTENINVLDELNKGACMGMDAIHFILEKVQDEELKKSMELQYNKYKDISTRITNIYSKYNSEDKPHETNSINKAMTWMMTEMKMMTDHSDSKIAELLLQGTNMGIIEGRKMLNHSKWMKK